MNSVDHNELKSLGNHQDAAVTLSQGRIPSLDGWRGIAILLVLIDHVVGIFHRSILGPWSSSGQHGVTIFFVLSGFLITTKLMESPGEFRRFYIRRFFRLLPVTWAFLLFLVILGKILNTPTLGAFETLSCILFFRNFIAPDPGYTAHFWSLSIEEQFYLVWPAILFLCGNRKAQFVALAGALACAACRAATWNNYVGMRTCETQIRADALLIGCLLALLVAEPVFRARIARWSNYLVVPAAIVLLFCMAHYRHLTPLVESLAIAVLLAASTLHPRQPMASVLSFAPLRWMGRVSYSVYVWNFIFFMMASDSLEGVAMMVLMWCFALLSYYFIELPCTRFGHRITRPRETIAKPIDSQPPLERPTGQRIGFVSTASPVDTGSVSNS
jgi:peptidoglycan/LPS O-acetylase OafA/YrhL